MNNTRQYTTPVKPPNRLFQRAVKGYEPFRHATDADHLLELLRKWSNDSSSLGGNYANGETYLPFCGLVVLSCFLSRSISIFKTYTKCCLLIVKIILGVGGVTTSERDFYDSLSSMFRRLEGQLTEQLSTVPGDASAIPIQNDGLSETDNVIAPEEALKDGLADLDALVGVEGVKQEVRRLMNFLTIRQQRIRQGMVVPKQSLHFVFTGNPGTGKTTVARILAKILYGFQILETPNLVEADRVAMVGGYVGQTAIKTEEVINKATNGVLFIDEAYTLAKSNDNDFGREAIDTLLKRMEDLRDKLVVIVAGYPSEMKQFIHSNPGLESRFSRYINFDDYHVSELCQIFDRMCAANEYRMTQEARANLAILFNRVFVNRDRNFGNARFVRNVYEKVIANQSDRLVALSRADITKDLLGTIEAEDLPYDLADGIHKPFDVSQSKWIAQCPKCEKVSRVHLALIGKVVKCKCGARFRCPWWNLEKTTVPGLAAFKTFDRPSDLRGLELPAF